MSKLSTFGLLVALVALCATVVSSAGASDWKTNGPVVFDVAVPSAVPSSNSLFKVTRSNGTSVTIGCTSTSANGTMNASPAAGTNPWLTAVAITPAFSTCRAGFPNSLSCGVATLASGLGSTYVGGATLGTSDGGLTQGRLTNFSCVLSFGPPCITITGTLNAQYINPVDATSTAGNLTIKSTGQSLTATGVGCAAIPTGAVQFGAANPAFGDLTYNVIAPATVASQPRIWYGS